MFLVVEPYGAPDDFWQATVVKSCATLDAAWSYYDEFYLRIAKSGGKQSDFRLVVVDGQRRPVARPMRSVQ